MTTKPDSDTAVWNAFYELDGDLINQAPPESIVGEPGVDLSELKAHWSLPQFDKEKTMHPQYDEETTMYVYSFDLSDFEEGQFVATRFPKRSAVGGDWVCLASSDEEALKLAQEAAHDEWAAPDMRDPLAFTVKFQDSYRLQSGE